MNAELLIYGFAPLLVYFIMDCWKGFRAGVITAIIVSCTILILDYIKFGSIDYFVIGETSLILCLGYISLKMGQDRYFKFQPTVVALIFAGVFAYFQLFDQPILVRYLPRLEHFVTSSHQDSLSSVQPAEILQILNSPEMHVVMSKISGACIWLFLAHGLVMAYAALRLSTPAWFAWRLAIYPAFFAVTLYYRLTM